MKKKKDLVDLNNARPGKYQEVIRRIGQDKICPFCKDHLNKIHPNPLDERRHWIITENAYPYAPKKQHLLLIHKKHVEDISEIKPEGWREFTTLIKRLSKDLRIEGGIVILRFGNTKYTGASVAHVHAHLFQSDPDHPDYDFKKGVITRVG